MGQPEMFNLKYWLSKILNSGTIPEQVWKIGFFQLHFQYTKQIQDNLGNSSNARGIGHPETYVWNCMHPPYLFFIPQIRILPSYFRNSSTPPPSKAKFGIFQSRLPPVSIWGGREGEGVTLWYIPVIVSHPRHTEWSNLTVQDGVNTCMIKKTMCSPPGYCDNLGTLAYSDGCDVHWASSLHIRSF